MGSLELVPEDSTAACDFHCSLYNCPQPQGDRWLRFRLPSLGEKPWRIKRWPEGGKEREIHQASVEKEGC